MDEQNSERYGLNGDAWGIWDEDWLNEWYYMISSSTGSVGDYTPGQNFLQDESGMDGDGATLQPQYLPGVSFQPPRTPDPMSLSSSALSTGQSSRSQFSADGRTQPAPVVNTNLVGPRAWEAEQPREAQNPFQAPPLLPGQVPRPVTPLLTPDGQLNHRRPGSYFDHPVRFHEGDTMTGGLAGFNGRLRQRSPM
ncbi:hypothetical protein O1611_g9235 [Lasiodiplodia mahajangana]|uniref:Uncharacterized protein n=1 Tax=Lasiodiplodia mahajangana TaxID=1108764 RepID=A0ACC2JAJ0_9PEZI|nr:hypothetical protein O1611_g9235 [Lasiodiplodia mahajangana]